MQKLVEKISIFALFASLIFAQTEKEAETATKTATEAAAKTEAKDVLEIRFFHFKEAYGVKNRFQNLFP